MPKIKLGIVGVRTYTNYEEFKTLLEKELDDLNLNPEVIISGGAKGADSLAERWAKENNVPITIHKPNYEKYPGHLAPLERNTLIVNDSDLIIAFWDGRSKGTKNTIKKAEKAGKDFIIKYI